MRHGRADTLVKRRLLNFVTGLSLLLCVAVIVLWVRSRAHPGSASTLLRGHRYTLTSESGVVALLAPPPAPADPVVRREVEQHVAALHNDQVFWDGWVRHEEGQSWMDVTDPPEPFGGTPAFQLERYPPADVARPLLATLEDPARAVAAHVLLAPQAKRQRPSCVPIDGDHRLAPNVGDFGSGPGGRAPWTRATFSGLNVTLNRWTYNDAEERNGRRATWDWGLTSLGAWHWGMAGDPDPDDLPRVRSAWHRRLDVRLAWAPHWALAAATASLPIARAGLRLRRRVLLRRSAARGKCRRCGYDLRATPGRCPECGTAGGGVTWPWRPRLHYFWRALRR